MKKIISFLVLFALCLGLTGCGNRQLIDMNYNFNKAIIQLQNGEVVEVEVQSWNDYDGEQLQVTSTDGTVYLTSSYNCTLIKE